MSRREGHTMTNKRNIAGVLGGIAAVALFLLVNPWIVLEPNTTAEPGRHGRLLDLVPRPPRRALRDAQGAGRRDDRHRRTGLHPVPVRQFARRPVLAADPAVRRVHLAGGRLSQVQRHGLDGRWRRPQGLLGARRGRPGRPGSPAITFDWYRTFIQTLLDNNAHTWFAPLIVFGEMAVGIGLLIGLLTGFAAFFGALMNMSFLLAGSASSNPVLFTLAIGLILGLEGRRLLRRRPIPPADARHPVASGQGDADDAHHATIGRLTSGLRRARHPAQRRHPRPPASQDDRGSSHVRLAAVAAEDPGRLVGRRPLLVGHELQAVVARVMGVAVEPPTEVLEPLDLSAGDRLEPAARAAPWPRAAGSRRGRTRCPPSAAAQAGVARAVREPRRVPSRPRSRPASRRRTAAASGRATAGRGGDCRATRSPPRRRSIRRSMTALRSIDEPRMPPVSRRSVGTSSATWRAAEPLLALEVGAEPDVEDALVDDRVHRRLLRAGTDRADRAAAGAHRLEQPDVDDVAGLGARRAHRRRRRRRIAADRCRVGRPDGCRRRARSRSPAAIEQPARDVAPEPAIERIERVAFGDGRPRRRGRRRPARMPSTWAREHRAREAAPAPRGRDPEREQVGPRRAIRVLATARRRPRSCPRPRPSRGARRAGRPRRARDRPPPTPAR